MGSILWLGLDANNTGEDKRVGVEANMTRVGQNCIYAPVGPFVT
jgi:hypothetical protein